MDKKKILHIVLNIIMIVLLAIYNIYIIVGLLKGCTYTPLNYLSLAIYDILGIIILTRDYKDSKK